MSSQQQNQLNNSTNNSNAMSQQKAGLSIKKCNCKQSQCIKLYCECYAAGVYCNGCHCINCKNNDQSEGWRNQAIQNTLGKNPTAFHPKISQKAEVASKVMDPLNLGKHNKGCACKRSGCMKKYCECYQAGVPCSENCKCTDCQNTGFVSHGNLLRQFREDDSYHSNNQILHKLLLAHNEEHLNSILSDQNGGSDFGFYKKGLPIKSEFIEESCMKLLQIIHLPDEDIFKRRDQLQSEKQNNNQNSLRNIALKDVQQVEGQSLFLKQQNSIEQQKKDKILKTPPQKSKRPDGTTGEGDAGQKPSENYNKDTYDIDMVCQDENMDEEEEQVDINTNAFNKLDINLNDQQQSKENKTINESIEEESTNISKNNNIPNKDIQNISEDNTRNLEQEKDGVNTNINNKEQHSDTEHKKRIMNSEEEEDQNIKDDINKTNIDGIIERNENENFGNDMEIEFHSSALKRKQELYEIRRLFILDTFIELLRHVEKTI